jgi:hypothetical protein
VGAKLREEWTARRLVNDLTVFEAGRTSQGRLDAST